MGVRHHSLVIYGPSSPEDTVSLEKDSCGGSSLSPSPKIKNSRSSFLKPSWRKTSYLDVVIRQDGTSIFLLGHQNKMIKADRICSVKAINCYRTKESQSSSKQTHFYKAQYNLR